MTINFGSTSSEATGTLPTLALDTWQLIGFTADINTGLKSISGTLFAGTSWCYFRTASGSYDLSSASVIRIGDETNSFNGQISTVRITVPGGGIVRTSKP